MEINIKPEEIDKYVKEAILQSTIGKVLADSSKKFIEDYCTRSYDSPIKHIIHNIVLAMLKSELQKPENQEIIKKAFFSHFNESTMNNIIYKMMDKIGIHAESIG